MQKVLVFQLGQEFYGLEVSRIQEVVEAPAVHYIPRAAECFLGAINVHGSIVPVLDLGAFLGFGAKEHDPRIIVLPPSTGSLALAVVAIKGFRSLEGETLLPYQDDGDNSACIRAVFNQGNEMINLLDVERLLAGMGKN